MKYFLRTNKRKAVFTAVALLFFLGASFSINIKPSLALLGFGGNILMMIPCVDEGSYAIVTGTPTPGVYIWTEATLMFKYYNLFTPGPWVLGGYLPNVGLTCTDDGVPVAYPTGIIESVGTSMIPV